VGMFHHHIVGRERLGTEFSHQATSLARLATFTR
jgi:hypothetical protein